MKDRLQGLLHMAIGFPLATGCGWWTYSQIISFHSRSTWVIVRVFIIPIPFCIFTGILSLVGVSFIGMGFYTLFTGKNPMKN